MIIMALDHVRDLLHVDSITQSPTDFTSTSPILFFTRWITHLCAPTFVFLSGASVFISLQRNPSPQQGRRFLLKRGLYLIVLEFTLVNFGLYFDLGFHNFIFEVIAAIGLGFIMLSFMSKWSWKILGVIGLIIIFCHNLTSLIPFAQDSKVMAILTPLFSPAGYPLGKTTLVIAYPPIPWLGIMLVGYAAGHFFEIDSAQRKKAFARAGLIALTLFVAIRFTNIYGEPIPWSTQKDAVFTFLSFINITKYPPSLLFCLATLGIALLILAAAENLQGRLSAIVIKYGKVPLFYFLAHFYLIHLILLLVLLLQGISWNQIEFATGTFGRPTKIPSGVSLGAVYLIWAGVVILLYKPCVWFGQYKASHQQWWLKYL
jgi:uncharacterized membrane protein